MSRDNWTTTDEANFQALQTRRSAVMVARNDKVLRVAQFLQSASSTGEVAAILQHEAHAFRKALEPFDNGPKDAAVEVAAVRVESPVPAHTPVPCRPPAAPGYFYNEAGQHVKQLDAMEVAAQGVREEVTDATRPGYRFTRDQASEAEQVSLRD